jgi:hypothetical protein
MKLKLRNVTNSTDFSMMGLNGFMSSGAGASNVPSKLCGVFTITNDSTIQIQARSGAAGTAAAFTFGVNEVYGSGMIQKIK